MNKRAGIVALVTVIFMCVQLFAQTGSTNSKQKQLEDLKRQLIEEQKTIQQQQEWNNQSSQQEVKRLNQENQQKNLEIQVSRQDAQKARQDAANAKMELQRKQIELAETELKIVAAKMLLAQTDSMLQTSESQKKRISEALQHQEDSVKMLTKEQELQHAQLLVKESELNIQKTRNKLYIIIIAISLILFTIIAALFLSRQKTLRELAEKNKIIQEEKRRSDELLLNILPEEVMHELKTHGKTQARNYAKATVLFADIKDFTKISERLTPDEVVEALGAYFERFDKVIEKYNIEKIKTIGDAYVCAGGVPTKNEDNPHMVVRASLEFIREVNKLREERSAKGLQTFEFRFGIHTGQLVAGVIGVRKFAYDIWGDTVNMAARMQQEGEVGKVNISGATYEVVKNSFLCVHRGKHEAKNKGEIDMYFVEKAIGG